MRELDDFSHNPIGASYSHLVGNDDRLMSFARYFQLIRSHFVQSILTSFYFKIYNA